ncbi:unnamed protein product [Ixodes pacificus]
MRLLSLGTQPFFGYLLLSVLGHSPSIRLICMFPEMFGIPMPVSRFLQRKPQEMLIFCPTLRIKTKKH